MIRLATISVTVIGLLAAQAPASARRLGPLPPHAKAPTGPTQCAFGAWQRWEGGAVRVMAAPDDRSALLGTLPVPDEKRDYPVYLDVIGTEPGWLHIAHASDAPNDQAGHPRREVFAGERWVSSDTVKIGVQSARGYLLPDAASPRIVDLGDRWLTEVYRIGEIHGCSGDWVLLTYHDDSDVRDMMTFGTAWFRGVCAIYETTCDMKSVDTPG